MKTISIRATGTSPKRSSIHTADGDIDTSRYTGESTEPRAGFQDIRMTVHVEADAEDERLEEWVGRVQDRCPVAENLRNESALDVSLESG